MAKRRRAQTRRKAPAARTIVVRTNPKRRRPRRGVAARRAPQRARRYRRNPSPRMEKLASMIVPAAGIGLGAVGAEILTGALPLPAQFKTGTLKHITKGVVGITAGMLVGTLLKQKRLGKYIAAGAVAIAVHDVAKEIIVKTMPSVPFGGYGQFVPAQLGYSNAAEMVQMGQFVPGFGEVVNGSGGETDFRA